jgi:Protein of unknown function (DUF1592)/Protein of unknown function (DUF1588)/Protein of unknown function (DUF1595)/Glycogen recognition site of AMP-activated protein kinase/Protein of unknown function (DUF1585)
MQRTTTRGWRIAQMAAIFALHACVTEIGDSLGDAGISDVAGPRGSDAGARPRDARTGSDDVGPDGAGGSDGDSPPTRDGGGTTPPVNDASTSDGTPPTSCAPPPRQLRLLTRREYRNTVRDLFQLGGATSCPHQFTFDAGAKQRAIVHVAGTFNQWAKTVAAGGWPLQWNGQKWTLDRDLAPGDYSYKFVLDESEWVTDATNPRQADDGQGGKNSLLTVACGGSGDSGASTSLPADPAANFPVESRPRKDNLSDLFPFDDASEKQVVSPTHIEEYWRAAKAITDHLSSQIASLVPCSGADTNLCAAQFVRQFGARVFRRPLRDDEMTRYQKLVTGSQNRATGLAAAVRAFLSSPHFLYRPEGSQVGTAAQGRLTAYETASALSYLLWGSMPDALLFEAAAAGRLDTPAGVETQARRLLADRRSREAVGQFALQWLGAEEILVSDKDASLFPDLSADLRASMVEETRHFVENVVFDSTHGIDELLRADYTFVDGALAALYGIPGVTGKTLQKQKYADPYRTGLLGHASLLGTYARSDQTSPIKRGLFVRRRLLCQDLPPPPADVPPVPAVDSKATTRERFRQHTSVPGCASCHRYIDGIGFGFERFDAIGRLRDKDNGQPVDATGTMNDVEGLGTNTSGAYTDIRGLADVVTASTAAKSCLATQYYRFLRGMFETEQSLCALGQIQTRFRDSGYDIRELIIALTQTSDFTTRR